MKSIKYKNYEIIISKRETISNSLNIAVTVGAILASIGLVSVLLTAYGVSPLEAFQIGISYVLSASGISGLIIRAIPLLLVGLSVYIPYRAGLYNIGGGAGIYAGGITAAAIGISTPGIGRLSFILSLLGGAIVGAIVLVIPGLLRAYADTNEILTTLLLTFIFIRLNDYAVTLMLADGGTLVGKRIVEGAVSPTLGGSSIHIGLFLAILAFAFSYILFRRMRFGYEIDMFGGNKSAAIRAGINDKKIIIGTFIIAGILSGLAGASEVVGLHGRLLPNFSPGYGFTAVAIAVIGRDSLFRVLGATLLFAFVYIWGARVELLLSVPTAIIGVFEATIILFFLVGEGIINYNLSLKKVVKTNTKEVISV